MVKSGGQEYIAESDRIRLRRSSPNDIEYVLNVEADPDNAAFIIRWSLNEHLEAIANASRAHWIIEHPLREIPLGYVILSARDSPHESIEFNRITISEKSRGYGREGLRLVSRAMFEDYGAHRLWLEVMTHNQRAHSLYLSEGFVEEVSLCECLLIDGRRVSLLVLSILRHEYERFALNQGSNPL